MSVYDKCWVCREHGIITGKLKHSWALERHFMCVFVATVIGPLPL